MVKNMSFSWVVSCIVLDTAVILANIVEESVIIRKWKNLDRIDHLLMSLSVSDLISGIITLTIDCWYLSTMKLRHMTSGIHKYFITVSYIFDSVFLFSVLASVLHVTAIAVERLYAIKFPRKYHIFTTYKCKLITMVFIWSVSLILTPIFTVIAMHTDRPILGEFIRGMIFMVIILSVLLVYVLIAYFLVKQRRLIIENFNGELGVEQDRLKRLTITCLFIGISFVVCFLPITLSFLNSHLYHDFSNMLVTLNSLINPCVYFAKVYYDTRSTTRPRSDTTHALLEIENATLKADVNGRNRNNQNTNRRTGSSSSC